MSTLQFCLNNTFVRISYFIPRSEECFSDLTRIQFEFALDMIIQHEIFDNTIFVNCDTYCGFFDRRLSLFFSPRFARAAALS